MRTLLTALACLSLTACASLGSSPPPGRVQTTDQVNRGSVTGAVSAPARDLNMLRTKIPQVLLDALEDPYRRPNPATCTEIIAQVRPLYEALGADIDDPASGGDERDLIDKGRDAAGETALGFVAGAAQDLIPLRSWVRRLSGAEQHDRLVRAAITAGGIRRGYLKGLGESRGCNPPATPSHLKSSLPQEPPRKGPRYPVK
ncbi:MAG: hypothetical protein Q7J28_02715 [Caulobacter sp.]|nr:hypothetical protein [Caulobacter sp.]